MKGFRSKTAGRFFAAAAAAVLMAAFCFLPQPARAASNFVIEDYAVKVVVNEDDTYEVTETISVRFTAPSHGIYRTIPLRTTLDRDGQKTSYYAKVKGFTMLSGDEWEDESEGGDFIARIGSPDRYAKTETLYTMRYTYDTRGDHFEGGDEFFYNLIGTSWEAQSIDHVAFLVQFPKAIDMNKVGIKTGKGKTVGFEAVSDTKIKGETTENVMGGLTVRAVLPEGYFTRQAKSANYILYIISALMIILAAVGFVLWRKYGRDPQIVETEEFYPPEKLSAPEVGYLDEGEVKGKHVVSSLLSLADRGYISISEVEKQTGRKKKKTKTTYEIRKLREYDEKIIGEKRFMKGLFKNGDVVDIKELEDKFYKTINSIEEDIEKAYAGKLYDEKAGGYAMALKVAGFIGIILITIAAFLTGGGPANMGGDSFIACIYSGAITVFLFTMGFKGITKKINERSHYGGIIGYGACIVVALALTFVFDIAPGVRYVPYVIGLGMSFLLYFMSALCERKTDWYAGILGKIRGYKNFLEVAEKDKMEALAEEDPQYFYKNLAFAFALGVTTVYAEHFASLATAPPEWYVSSGGYVGSGSGSDGPLKAMSFIDSMDSMMSSISSSMTSSPSDGGGGGSFSGGGGGGGGGGGSW